MLISCDLKIDHCSLDAYCGSPLPGTAPSGPAASYLCPCVALPQDAEESQSKSPPWRRHKHPLGRASEQEPSALLARPGRGALRSHMPTLQPAGDCILSRDPEPQPPSPAALLHIKCRAVSAHCLSHGVLGGIYAQRKVTNCMSKHDIFKLWGGLLNWKKNLEIMSQFFIFGKTLGDSDSLPVPKPCAHSLLSNVQVPSFLLIYPQEPQLCPLC